LIRFDRKAYSGGVRETVLEDDRRNLERENDLEERERERFGYVMRGRERSVGEEEEGKKRKQQVMNDMWRYLLLRCVARE
jgi:hypothetical protein